MSGSPWSPVHHEELDTDEPGSQADPQHRDRGIGGTDGARPKKEDAQAPVGLTLALPQSMIDAMLGCAEAWTRVALAVEANTAATRTLIDRLTGVADPGKIPSE